MATHFQMRKWVAFVVSGDPNMRTIPIQPRVDRDLYFRFRALCHANGVTVERAVEELIRAALERAGVSDDAHREVQTKPM
jgi:hypothetical protein